MQHRQRLSRAGEHKYSFSVYNPGSLSHHDIGSCGWNEFGLLADPAYSQIPEEMPMMVILGQQKSGTTWFQNALIKHPAVIAPRPLARSGACAPPPEAQTLAIDRSAPCRSA